MKPVSPVCLTLDIPEVPIAKDQPEYQTLPSIQLGDKEGTIVTRWELTWKERLQVLFGGSIWLMVMTFKHPVQPLIMSAKCPMDHTAMRKGRR